VQHAPVRAHPLALQCAPKTPANDNIRQTHHRTSASLKIDELAGEIDCQSMTDAKQLL